MQKTLFILCALSMFSMFSQAANITWTGQQSHDWTNKSNWSVNATPSAGDTINIHNATVNWISTGGSIFGSTATIYNITGNSIITLGNTTATTSTPISNPRFDGQFNVGEGSVLNMNSMFSYGSSTIDGTINLYNEYAPGANNTLIFGVNGVINMMQGSRNGVEGNNRTSIISASLSTGTITENSTFSVEKRYLIAGYEGGSFNKNLYQSWTLEAGSIMGTNSTILTASSTALTATAEDFGKYILSTDSGGVYVQYVQAVPEPSSIVLSFLGFSCILLRRRV